MPLWGGSKVGKIQRRQGILPRLHSDQGATAKIEKVKSFRTITRQVPDSAD